MGSIRRDEGGNPPRLFDFIRRDEEGRPSPSRLFDFIQHDEEGRPSSLCLFDFIRHDEEGRPSPSCPFDVLRCDKAPNTRSVPIWAYSWCSCPLHLTRHVKRAHRIKSNRCDGEGLPSSSRRIKSNRRGGFPPSSRRIEPIDATGRVSPLRCVQWTQTDATGRGK